MHATITFSPEKSTYAKVVMMISEDENRKTAIVMAKEIHHYIDRNGISCNTEIRGSGLVIRNSNT